MKGWEDNILETQKVNLIFEYNGRRSEKCGFSKLLIFAGYYMGEKVDTWKNTFVFEKSIIVKDFFFVSQQFERDINPIVIFGLYPAGVGTR